MWAGGLGTDRLTMASVRLDAMLREFAPRLQLSVNATSVAGMLDELETQFPRLRYRLRDETGRLRPFVRVFLNGEEIDRGNGLATAIGTADSIDILHSIQGG